MDWSSPSFAPHWPALRAAFRDARWPEPPPGFEPVDTPRAMRQVLRGPAAPGGPIVAVKWHRPTRAEDHIARFVRGGRGPREGRLLTALQEAALPVPAAVAYTDEGTDLLVTGWLDGLEPLPPINALHAQGIADLATVMRQLFDAGVSHRDLTHENLMRSVDGLVLIDLGGARIRRSLDEVTFLARLRHTLLSQARRTQRLRALRAWRRTAPLEEIQPPLAELALAVEAGARKIRRRFLSGRDRRATRSGRHFRRYRTAECHRAIRARACADARYEDFADAWINADPPDAVSLKSGDRVMRFEGPDGQPLVLKRFGPVMRGRLPRPLRAFRRAEALRNRGLAVPRPLLAAAKEDGNGIVVSDYVEGTPLHEGIPGSGAARRRRLAQIGRELRSWHEAEVSHRDWKAPNLLWSEGDGGRVFVVDLEGARVRRSVVPWPRRMRDLARLDASLAASATDRLRVWRAYLQVLPHPPLPERELLGMLAAHVAHKRGPSGLPR